MCGLHIYNECIKLDASYDNFCILEIFLLLCELFVYNVHVYKTTCICLH